MIKVGEVANYTGILFQLGGKRTDEFSDDELWEKCKEEAANKTIFPYTIEMPCGATQRIKEGWQMVRLPIEDIPCPCGDPTHWLVQFRDFRG